MKKSKVEEFINKVDRPWGMSKEELEQFQNEVIQLRKENEELKKQSKQLAVEKLEELYELFFKLTDIDFEDKLVEMINELKGEKDE